MADQGRSVSCGRDYTCVPDLTAALNVASKGGLVWHVFYVHFRTVRSLSSSDLGSCSTISLINDVRLCYKFSVRTWHDTSKVKILVSRFVHSPLNFFSCIWFEPKPNESVVWIAGKYHAIWASQLPTIRLSFNRDRALSTVKRIGNMSESDYTVRYPVGCNHIFLTAEIGTLSHRSRRP